MINEAVEAVPAAEAGPVGDAPNPPQGPPQVSIIYALTNLSYVF